jgi:RNA polymerase sigma-70 factor, ECF subfamily
LNLRCGPLVRTVVIEGETAVTERAALASQDGPETDRSDADRATAFVRLADRQVDRSYRLAALLLGSEIEAQDAVQDAAVAAWERFASLRDPARFEAWFQRILVNNCRDRVRRRGRIRLLPMGGGAEPPTPDSSAGFAERAALRDALATLSSEHREVVVLRFLADLSLDEIAERTGERLGTVKSRLHYGLSALRAAYDAAARLPGETSR